MHLDDIAPDCGGLRDEHAWVFNNPSDAIKCVERFGGRLTLPPEFEGRPVTLRLGAAPNHYIIASVPAKGIIYDGDGWVCRGRRFLRCLNISGDQRPLAEQLAPVDACIRYVAPGREIGTFWVVDDDGEWSQLSGSNARDYAAHKFGKANTAIGMAVAHRWALTSVPFGPVWDIEARSCNLRAPQLKVTPTEGPFPHWRMILDHIGADLNDAASKYGYSGADYLAYYLASILQNPYQPLPYLFLFGPEDSGKSILHESVGKYLVTGGVVSGARALTSDFSGELDGAIIIYIEEVDIHRAGVIERIKQLVTSPTVAIRRMRTDQYQVPNSLHFVQCANSRSFCPILPGDTRIVPIYVEPLADKIPRAEMDEYLEAEAPAFLHHLLNLTLPETVGRLHLPVLETESKLAAIEASINPITAAVAELMADRDEWSGTARDLANATGDGTLPTDSRLIGRHLDADRAYLTRLGIEFRDGGRSARGKIWRFSHV